MEFYQQLRRTSALFFRDAFHPILYLNNKQKNEITHPQTIELNQRIIVISGP
jgi:DNA mismatch repair protein MutS2